MFHLGRENPSLQLGDNVEQKIVFLLKLSSTIRVSARNQMCRIQFLNSSIQLGNYLPQCIIDLIRVILAYLLPFNDLQPMVSHDEWLWPTQHFPIARFQMGHDFVV